MSTPQSHVIAALPKVGKDRDQEEEGAEGVV